jgi:DNA-binding Lrp family transcriptional regulator
MVNPEKIWVTVHSFIAITLTRHEADVIRQFEGGFRRISHVQPCYHLILFDCLLHFSSQDIILPDELVKTIIAGLQGFGISEMFVIFSEIKLHQGQPIESNHS